MIIFYAPDIATYSTLPEDESSHAIRVLRHRQGDVLTIVDGMGHYYDTTIVDAHPKSCEVRIDSQRTEEPRPYRIEIAVAPTKNLDRMEWLVEKAVEMGVERVTPLRCRFSERRDVKIERLQRIAVSAMKQSLKATLPQIDPMTDIDDYLSEPFDGQKFIAHCDAEQERFFLSHKIKPSAAVRILIGPEGDFSAAEIAHSLQAAYQPVSLGRERLRTETAALAAVHTVHVVNELV